MVEAEMRLQKTRRLMLGENLDAASAGYRVGYYVYLGGYLISGLLCITPYCVPGGVRSSSSLLLPCRLS
jgi:hypothetical protein